MYEHPLHGVERLVEGCVHLVPLVLVVAPADAFHGLVELVLLLLGVFIVKKVMEVASLSDLNPTVPRHRLSINTNFLDV